MRLTSKGQVTIPAAIREKSGLLPGTNVEFKIIGETVRIMRARDHKGTSRGARLIAHMRDRGDVNLDTDAIMAFTRDA